jgi:predicted dehydrogenase
LLNVAILGLGTTQSSATLHIGAALDPDPAASAFAARHGLRLARDYAAVLNDPAIQAVILCTPHTLHAAQIVQAAHAGKHVFCEKPLCLTRDDAARAIAACTICAACRVCGVHRITAWIAGSFRTAA